MIIGVTGHRDLKEECLGYYEKQVHLLLADLKRKYSNIMIYSPLSDGADRIIVQEGIKLSIPFIAVLPMPKDKYIMDFNNHSLKEFENLLKQAEEIITTSLCHGNNLEEISAYSTQRDMQYESCGHYIVDSCDSLIALWDGKYIGLIGGTGEIIKYYLNKHNHSLHHLLVSRSKDIKDILVKFKLYDSS